MVERDDKSPLDLVTDIRPALVENLQIRSIRILDNVHLELLVNDREQIISTRFAEVGTDLFEKYDDDFWADEEYKMALIELINSGELAQKLSTLPTSIIVLGEEYHFWAI